MGLSIQKINIDIQIIDSTILKTYKIVISIFSILIKDGRVKFFKENLLLVDVRLNIIFEMVFLIINDVDIDI